MSAGRRHQLVRRHDLRETAAVQRHGRRPRKLFGGLLPVLWLLGYVSVSLAIAAAPLALIGMMLYENAYVQAGQSVPLA